MVTYGARERSCWTNILTLHASIVVIVRDHVELCVCNWSFTLRACVYRPTVNLLSHVELKHFVQHVLSGTPYRSYL